MIIKNKAVKIIMKKVVKTLLIIGSILFVIFISITVLKPYFPQGPGPMPPIPSLGRVGPPIPSPGPVEMYKGIRDLGGQPGIEALPALPGAALFDDLERLKENGFNAIGLYVQYKPDKFGHVEEVVFRHPNPALSMIFKTSMEELIIPQIQEAHKNGFRVHLSLMLGYPEELGGGTDIQYMDTYLENMAPGVLKWAEIAEKYHVELFTPLAGPDDVFDLHDISSPERHSFYREKINRWHQQIIPKIRKKYHGTLVSHMGGGWKGEVSVADSFDYDHRGFDYIGFDIWPFVGPKDDPELEDFRVTLRQIIEIQEKKVKRDKAKGIMIMEAGGMVEEAVFARELAGGVALGKEGQAKAFKILFEETWGKVDGYFLGFWRGLSYYRIKGNPSEQIIKEWFGK